MKNVLKILTLGLFTYLTWQTVEIALGRAKLPLKQRLIVYVVYAFPSEWSWVNHTLGRHLLFIHGLKAVGQGISQEATAY
jgi:hypothetical protein